MAPPHRSPGVSRSSLDEASQPGERAGNVCHCRSRCRFLAPTYIPYVRFSESAPIDGVRLPASTYAEQMVSVLYDQPPGEPRDGGSSRVRSGSVRTGDSTTVEKFLRRLLSAGTVTGAAQAAVDTAREALSADVSWSGVISGNYLTMAAYSGLRTAEMPAYWRLEVGQGIGGRVAKEARTIACRDYRRDPRRVPVMKNVIDHEGIRGGACAPLLAGSEVLGVLYACQRHPRNWTSAELHLLTDIARDTGTVLEQIRERHKQQQRAEIAERAAQETTRTVDVVGAIAMSLARTEDIGVGIGVLAHHLGLRVELLEPGGEVLCKAPPGDGRGEKLQLQITVGDEPLGSLQISGGREPTTAERELVTLSADVIALQLLRERAALRAESRVHSEFLDDLLEGRLVDRPAMLARAALLGLDLKVPRHVACIGLRLPLDAGSGDSPPAVTRQLFSKVERKVQGHSPRSTVIPRGGDVVVLLEARATDPEQVHRLLREVLGDTGATGGDLVAGLGRMCLGLADYADSYAEAALALDIARRRSKTGEVLSQADLGLYGLLAKAPTRQSLESVVANALGPLIEADAASGSEYVKTLHAYLDADRHLEHTAAALHVHPNTVRYRLTKAQDMLGVDLRDVDDRFLLELALRVQASLER
ncbi:MAG: GAF domain-containing protein [Actinophytocola sp.]|nr:GAF domain-containing protein [Actinophytocola sp.]